MRVAVVGCGHLGAIHARLLRELPEADLRLVHDVNPARAQTLADALGVMATTDLRAVIDGADAVVVASPTSTHAEVAGELLAARRHVLVEKPITTTVEEARALVAAARAAGCVLAVGHVERWNPAFRAARGRFGIPRFLEGHRLAPFVPRSLDVDVVLDLMIHDLDLALAVVGQPVEAIEAVGVPVLTPAEDIANARLRFRGGAVANLTASRVSREKVRKLRAFSARRYISVDFAEGRFEEVLLEGIPADVTAGAAAGTASRSAVSPGATGLAHASSDAPPEDPADETSGGGDPAELVAVLASRGLRLVQRAIPAPVGNALRDELADFLRQVRGERSEHAEGASGEDGLACLEVALEVRRRVRESLPTLTRGL